MKKILIFLFSILAINVSIFAQDAPVEVETSIEKISESEYDLIFKFEIEDGWHLYSQHNPENASQPLRLSAYEGEEGYMLIGDAEEKNTHTEFSETWGVEEVFFSEDTGKLIQRIQVDDLDLNQITITVRGQACSEFCLPFEDDFTFALNGGKVEEEVVEIDDKSVELTNSLKLDLKNTELLYTEGIGSTDEDGKIKKAETNLFTVFFLGFVGGLLAFLTPCVFPLVPLTVSFFTKQSTDRKKGIFNAVMYGMFILIIYLLLSAPFHFLDSLDPEILTTISTNVWLNLFFFIILVFFAGSFFGFYEITLPSSWGNKMDSASGIGGVLGIFFMALTLAIVSFSCTGPILGSLLAGSLTGGAWPLTAGMGGFGLALALPFALFALFPSLLNTLPKSGGWMTTIKILLGFIEVALAFKFLSSADLVGHWGLFYREIFIAIWLIILVVSVLFLFGILRFPGNNRKIKRVAGIRILLGILAVSGIIYLAPGLMKKPIWNQSLLSGLAPPEYHTIYDKGDSYCPLNLTCFKDFDEGMAYAKKENKPVLLDFTGWACVNCRKMEETVWRENAIYKMLKDDIVLISLYVDDNEKRLPVEQQFDYIKPNGKKKRIKTYGGKWATMQAENFKTASQPYYVLMSPDLEILNSPQQYTDSKEYYDWLKEGITNYSSSEE